MPYRQLLDRSRLAGIPGVEAAFAEQVDKAAAARGRLAASLRADPPGFLVTPSRRREMKPILGSAEHYRASFRRVAILGTGGSSLGGQVFAGIARRGQGPALVFADNADPVTFAALTAPEALAETGYIAISKSGATTETLAQLLLLIDAIRREQSAAALETRLMLVTAPGDNPMRRLARRFGLAVVDHPADVGGRFSALTVSGLLPAAIAGLDVAALRAGAQAVVDDLGADDFAPAAGAAFHLALEIAGVSQTVLMPYGDALRPLALWWRQLWAESLGKNGRGLTPIAAVGAVDQHSQLQLYLDGPTDKSFTLIGIDETADGAVVPGDLADDPDLAYLRGHGLGALLAAMRQGTADSLAAAGLPVREIFLPRLDEKSLGAVMMHFMIETVLVADMLGADPYDQPAVEDGKNRARAALAGEELS